MNPVIDLLFSRKSVRAFEDRDVSTDLKNLIIDSAIQAPTAGNQVLYTILDIEDQHIKDRLAVLCDDQPFIARAPVVLVFLADCRRWMDCYELAGESPRKPGPGDLLLASADALIAAQNAVIAAESLGLGSCYIGDILENREDVVTLLALDDYVVPAAMLVIGWPTRQQVQRPKPPRFDKTAIVCKNVWSRHTEDELRGMFTRRHEDAGFDFNSYVSAFCKRKYHSGFAEEMNRSAEGYLSLFPGPDGSGSDR